MSMYRQLWLSIFFSVLIALTASLLVSLLNARSYLEAQLAMKNQDNAAALSLALSQGNSDAGTVSLAVTALFNGGHYELIHVIDPNGRVLVDKVTQGGDAGAPGWFVGLLPIRSLPGRAEIASGWHPIGTLTLMSSSRFAYRSLWETAMTMSAVMLAAGLLGGLLTSLVLRRITKPMNAVMEQARAINDHRFITIPLPDVPEVRQLAAAMNDTVNRLHADFEEDARRYEALRQQANYDPLTGLPNRTFFLASLDSALDDEDTPYGALAIIRLRMLGKINRRQGRDVADEMLRQVGHALGELSITCSGTYAGRLNGGDFALLLGTGCDPAPTLNELLTSLPNVVVPLAGDYSTTYIGYSRFSRGDNPTRLLARIDEALAAADVDARSVVREAAAATSEALPDGADQWRDRLRQALAEPAALSLANYPIRVGTGVQREGPLRLRLDEPHDWLPAARFLPLADRIGLVPQLDLAALDLAVAVLEQDSQLEGLWLNLAAKSISDAGFRRSLLALLEAHPVTRRRLHLEIPEGGALSSLAALRELCRDLKPLECRIGLEHYGHRFNRIGELYEIGLDFLKVDASFIQGLDANPGNQAFLAGLCEIAHSIGMQVFAEGVERQEDLDQLQRIGFDGYSGLLLR